MTPAATATPHTGPHTGFVYDGRLGELYGIFLPNLLWTILTLTVFRFWAKTRMRRYLWSRTSLNGDRFEYTGTGGEMFIGFLIVMPFYVLFILGSQLAYYHPDVDEGLLVALQSVGAILILYLVFVAQYAAQRYRLTRTLWRGIRGGMTGSPWIWGLKAFFFAFLSLLTLSLAWPWSQMRLLGDRINNSYFGDAKAQAAPASKPVYGRYIIGIVISGVATIIIMAALGFATYAVMQWLGLDLEDPEALEQSRAFYWSSMAIGGIAYLLLSIAYIIAFSFYQTAVFREVARKLELGGLRFATRVTSGRLIARYVGNLLIIVFTLGLGLPIAIHRTMLFLAANIEVVGEIEGSDVTHANLRRPRAGEGLLEAFDPGIF
jgi:uncharacterized membrane protein YjgN (DUF898 family)